MKSLPILAVATSALLLMGCTSPTWTVSLETVTSNADNTLSGTIKLVNKTSVGQVFPCPQLLAKNKVSGTSQTLELTCTPHDLATYPGSTEVMDFTSKTSLSKGQYTISAVGASKTLDVEIK